MRRFATLLMVVAMFGLVATPVQAAKPQLDKTSSKGFTQKLLDVNIDACGRLYGYDDVDTEWTFIFTVKETKDGGQKGFFTWTEDDDPTVHSWEVIDTNVPFSAGGGKASFEVAYARSDAYTLDESIECTVEVIEKLNPDFVFSYLEVEVEDFSKEDGGFDAVQLRPNEFSALLVQPVAGDLKVKAG